MVAPTFEQQKEYITGSKERLAILDNTIRKSEQHPRNADMPRDEMVRDTMPGDRKSGDDIKEKREEFLKDPHLVASFYGYLKNHEADALNAMRHPEANHANVRPAAQAGEQGPSQQVADREYFAKPGDPQAANHMLQLERNLLQEYKDKNGIRPDHAFSDAEWKSVSAEIRTKTMDILSGNPEELHKRQLQVQSQETGQRAALPDHVQQKATEAVAGMQGEAAANAVSQSSIPAKKQQRSLS